MVDKVVEHSLGSMDRGAGDHSDKYHCTNKYGGKRLGSSVFW